MGLGFPQANLLGHLFEGLIYGAYFVISIKHTKVLYSRRSSTLSYRYLAFTSTAIFLMTTVHLVVDFLRALHAFTSDMATPNAPLLYFENYSTSENRIRDSINAANTIVADSFLVYRCYIVWGRRYSVVVLPFLFLLASSAVSIWMIMALWGISGDPLVGAAVAYRCVLFVGFTLGNNLLCTILISYKIWKIHRDVVAYAVPLRGYYRHRLSHLSMIIIESAAVYSAYLFALIVTEVLKLPVFFLFWNTMPPVVGIVFSSIIVRAGSESDKPYSQRSSVLFASRTQQGREVTIDNRSGVNDIEIHLETVTRVVVEHSTDTVNEPAGDPKTRFLSAV